MLAVAATAGMMRRSGGITARECAAALDHMRELIAAKDRTGQMLARFDAQRSVLAAGCKGAGDARQRRCVLAATSFDELERCPQ
ncbi:MAG: hypothetical protein IPL61_27335 [Myxococcales bacterium]|nr:hypothetical protein [Myxococcales bacterium]